jgi:hypothetical protein
MMKTYLCNGLMLMIRGPILCKIICKNFRFSFYKLSLFIKHSQECSDGTIAIIKFWTSFFYHIKKITLNHALLKLSHMNDEIVVKFIHNLPI